MEEKPVNSEIVVEETQKCTKCGVVKPLDGFAKGQDWCRDCIRRYYQENKEKICKEAKEYREKNKEKVAEWHKAYYEENKEELSKKGKEYRQNNKEKVAEKKRKYYEEHKEEIAEYKREYDKKNADKVAARRKRYAANNKEKLNKRRREYRAEKKDILAEKRRAYENDRHKNDVFYRLRKVISGYVRHALKEIGSSKENQSCKEYLPFEIEELKKHLEALFEPWMTWDNYGPYNASKWDDNDQSTWTWHIDHITPHSYFRYQSMDCQEFRDCWALSNLRPLSAKQNVFDGDRRKNGIDTNE